MAWGAWRWTARPSSSAGPATTLAVGIPGRRPPPLSCLGRDAGRADVHFAAVQHLDRDAVPADPAGVLDYARGVLDAGFPPGVIMIDDRWSPDYGDWHSTGRASPIRRR